MNKLLFPLLFIAFLTACDEKEKNVAYYSKHLDEAKQKVELCQEKAIAGLLFTLGGDTTILEEFKQEKKECEAANTAWKEHKKKYAELEKQKREKVVQESLAKARAEIEPQYKGLNWQQVIRKYANSECHEKYFIANDDYLCKAEQNLYKENVEYGKAELVALGFEQLIIDENKYCLKDKREYSVCSVWKEAVENTAKQYFEKMNFIDFFAAKSKYCLNNSDYICNLWGRSEYDKEKEVVNYYIENYEALRTDYNHCLDQLETVQNSSSYQYNMKYQIEDSYPCKQAKTAKSRLNLGYGFDKKME